MDTFITVPHVHTLLSTQCASFLCVFVKEDKVGLSFKQEKCVYILLR